MKSILPLQGITVLEWGGLPAAFAGRILSGLGAEVWVVTPLRESARDSAEASGVRPIGLPHPGWLAHLDTGKRFLPFAITTNPSAATEEIFARFQSLITAPAPHFTAKHEAAIRAVGASGQLPAWVCIDPHRFRNGHEGEVFPAARGLAETLPELGAPRELWTGIYAACLSLLQLEGHIPPVAEVHAVEVVQELCGLFSLEGDEEARYWDRGFALLPTRDGEVSLSLLGNWSALAHGAAATGAPSWLTRPEFDNIAVRYRHAEAIFATLARWSCHWRAGQLTRWAQLRRIPVASVRSPSALAHCPQIRRRRFFAASPAGVREEHPSQMRLPPLFLQQRVGSPENKNPKLGKTRNNQSQGPSFVPLTSDVPMLHPKPPNPGTRILDFTWAVAGPLATLLLAKAGAQVIKIDPPGTSSTPVLHPKLFAALRRGKECLELDAVHNLTPLQELVRQSDVVIDNFSARVLDNWGLTHQALARLRPGIIQVKMTAFGLSGPLRHWIGYAPTIHAWSGHTWLLARLFGQRLPGGWPLPYADLLAGLFAFLAVLAGLWYRARTGHGLLIDLSQYECAVFALGPHAFATTHTPATNNVERPLRT